VSSGAQSYDTYIHRGNIVSTNSRSFPFVIPGSTPKYTDNWGSRMDDAFIDIGENKNSLNQQPQN